MIFDLFELVSNKRCGHEELVFQMMYLLKKAMSDNLIIILYFCLILSDVVLDDMIFLVKTDTIFTLDYVDIEEL